MGEQVSQGSSTLLLGKDGKGHAGTQGAWEPGKQAFPSWQRH